jgi:hypothetical protein
MERTNVEWKAEEAKDGSWEVSENQAFKSSPAELIAQVERIKVDKDNKERRIKELEKALDMADKIKTMKLEEKVNYLIEIVVRKPTPQEATQAKTEIENLKTQIADADKILESLDKPYKTAKLRLEQEKQKQTRGKQK